MGGNLYRTLSLAQDASQSDIKKAYRKKALKYHPDKVAGDPEAAKTKWLEISEAYDVLSDEKKKGLYDKFGEAGINPNAAEAPDGGGPSVPGGFAGGMPGGTNVHHMSQEEAQRIFSSFFGTGDAFSASRMGGGGDGGMGDFSSLFGGGAGGPGMMFNTSSIKGGRGGGVGGGSFQPQSAAPQQQAAPVETPLSVSLEDLYKGVVKRVRITKKLASGGTGTVEKSINIKKGWKNGTRITYPREGDENPGVIPSDIVFVLKTKAHEKFIRDDKDLITTSEISLKDAVEGYTTNITTLDGRRLRVSEPFLSHSHCQTVLTGEGMPSQRAGGEPGDLIIKYRVKFPIDKATRTKVARSLA